MPKELLKISHPCGNTMANADLLPGDTLLDLASGAGLDCFIASGTVGNDGKVYGLELTKEMLGKAIEFRRQLDIKNVQFLHGDMEQIPMENGSVDVVTINCGLSLVSNKERVLAEIARVLTTNGYFVAADVTSKKPVPRELREDADAWSWCVGGCLTIKEWEGLLKRYFTKFDIRTLQQYPVDIDDKTKITFETVLIKAYSR
ncbi:methyltransferase domain-containing protein [Metallumcola ferriviriculae]|uniref:Arsenite methyltransferase n=1 Tax=Metallumcola ferriviriculae TaxID=3039180 RepID=A0AAU0UQT1_9FIRM|nr:methyltransferase domain-containing protein [Desulfitibacteraceae bacterium MK1]